MAATDESRFEGMGVLELLERLLVENRQLNRNLTDVQDRSGDLLEYGRACRRKIVELGGEDPGSPSEFRCGR
jgi:hypothetical protein